MKLISYKSDHHHDQYRIGFLLEGNVYDLQNSYRLYLQQNKKEVTTTISSKPSAFFSQGFQALEKAKKVYHWISDKKENIYSEALEDVKLGPPNPSPEKILCVGLNYKDHIKEMNSEVQEYPVLFSKFNNALIGPEDPIEKSPLTEKLDYEVELVIVIGKEATNVKREDAFDYILGYTVGNDTSARDLQKRTPQWLQGKSLDRSTPIGPWIVTANEIDPTNLKIKGSVNEEVRQSSNTKHFIFDIPYLIEFISHLITLNPGDLIFTGTPDGVGMGLDPQKFLQAGDIVTMEIENIGILQNKVIDKA